MSTNSCDPWLLPRHQTEYPARDVLPEATVHGRREVTFLVLAAAFLVATSALVLLGTSRVVDVAALASRFAPALELPIAMLVPLGAIPFAVSFVASALVCELFGRRRATALLWVGLTASMALVGLMRVADATDGGDAFGPALALAACCLVAHAGNILVFDALRRRARGRHLFARVNIASAVALGAGWATFGGVLHVTSGQLGAPIGTGAIVALATGAAVCSVACVLVLALPVAVAARGLVLALRVRRDPVDDDEDDLADGFVSSEPALVQRAREPAFAEGSVARKLPPAVIVDDDELPDELPRAHARPASIPPFSSAEMRFFAEGDLQ